MTTEDQEAFRDECQLTQTARTKVSILSRLNNKLQQFQRRSKSSPTNSSYITRLARAQLCLRLLDPNLNHSLLLKLHNVLFKVSLRESSRTVTKSGNLSVRKYLSHSTSWLPKVCSSHWQCKTHMLESRSTISTRLLER